MCDAEKLLCPSVPAHLTESVLIGVVTGTPEASRVVPTATAMTVTQEILNLAGLVSPSEVFRFASRCRAEECVHFKNAACQIAARGVTLLDEIAGELPRCPIRSQCRWFRQEGAAMCRRCPQIVTDQYLPSDEMLRVVNCSDPPMP